MRDRHRLWWAVVLLLTWPMGQSFAAPAAVKPIVTNKLRFRIPFRFDAAALQRMNARELQLFVSTNRGATWGLAQSINPQSGRFEYQAASDGEYWFAVRTLDAFGQAHPAGEQLDPGLIVVVDTVPPQLDLQLQPLGSGKVQLSWQSHDPHLDPATLRLEYLQPGSADWQAVSVVPRNSGQTSWSVPQGGLVSVRGSISDQAGNQGLKQSQAAVTAGSDPASRPTGPALREPIAETTFPDDSPPTLPPAPTMPVITPGPTRDATALGASPTFISGQTAFRPEIMQDRWSNPEAPTVDTGNAFRPQARQRIVSTRKFQLGYKVDDVGPSGVGGVDLFISQDQGRRWWRYGEDTDRTSPFDVQVPQEGEYGFTVRVRSGAGLSLDPPTPGEPPSISIIVDLTPPALELLPVQQGQGSSLNQVMIRWRSSDAHPSDKPISLYYAPTADGPWELISGWRQDTGSFAWNVGPGAPTQFYVRVLARDAAGNATKAETPQPIVVDLTRPSARIVDVEVQPSPQ
jgi:hypothetical protein